MPKSHRIAWNGLSFEVPSNWDFASYQFKRRGVTRIELEDEFNLRLEAEWLTSRTRLDLERIRGRYLKRAKRLANAARSSSALSELPVNWQAFVYEMADRHRLATAYFLAADSQLFAFFTLHFTPQSDELPAAIVRRLARNCNVHRQTVPWQVYDLHYELPVCWRLIATEFQAGRKLMRFQWRLRRLFVWHCSLADMLLRDTTASEWSAKFLSARRDLKGPRFEATAEGTVRACRTWRYPVGHSEEIGRLCFRYLVYLDHDPDQNSLTLVVLQHRRQDDLQKLPAAWRGEPGDTRLGQPQERTT